VEGIKLPQVTSRYTDNKLSPKVINFVFFGISGSDEPYINNKPTVMCYGKQPWQIPPERTEVI